MEALRNIGMRGGFITEYCGNEAMNTYDAVSAIADANVNEAGKLVVYCQDFEPERTIVFSPKSWRCEVSGDMILLSRIGPDIGDVDIPTPAVDRYMIDETFVKGEINK